MQGAASAQRTLWENFWWRKLGYQHGLLLQEVLPDSGFSDLGSISLLWCLLELFVEIHLFYVLLSYRELDARICIEFPASGLYYFISLFSETPLDSMPVTMLALGRQKPRSFCPLLKMFPHLV